MPSEIDERREHERQKYLQLANKTGGSYGRTNHGRDAASAVLAIAPEYVIDFGCGRNNFINNLRQHGLVGSGLDFAFPEADVHAPMHATGYLSNCADMIVSFDALEHLLPEDVPLVFTEMRRVARPESTFIFSIATRPSVILVNGENLHPTVKPIAWWHDQMSKQGFTVGASPFLHHRYVTGVLEK